MSLVPSPQTLRKPEVEPHKEARPQICATLGGRSLEPRTDLSAGNWLWLPWVAIWREVHENEQSYVKCERFASWEQRLFGVELKFVDFYVISNGGASWGVALAAPEVAIGVLESRPAVTRRLLSIPGERLQATLIHRLLIAISEFAEHALKRRTTPGFERNGFNLDYLLTIARLAGTVTVSASSKGDPAHLVGDDPDALWIVMPMRL